MKTILTLTFCFVIFYIIPVGSQNSCIQKFDKENYASYKKIIKGFQTNRSYDGSFPTVRLSLNRIRNSAGSTQNILTWNEIDAIIQGMVDYFEGNICFTVIEKNEIDNDGFFTLNDPFTTNTITSEIIWNQTYLNLLNTNVGDNNSIRIYFFRTFAPSISTNPIWDDSPTDDFTVSLFKGLNTNAPSHNPEILAHEIGHCFGLLHTHETRAVNGIEIKENVTRDEYDPNFNCEMEGDLLCDTPADFNIKGLSNSTLFDQSACMYIGNEVDDVGEPYDIDVKNIMSYSLAFCMEYFKEEQIDRALNFINETDIIDPIIIPEDVVISGNQNNGIFNNIAENSIISTSSYSLQNVGRVSYQAKTEIILSPGFEISVTTNSNMFTAKIVDYNECFNPLIRIDGFTENSDISRRNSELDSNNYDFEMYPNPNDLNFLHIKFKDDSLKTVIIRGIDGTEVLSKKIRHSLNRIDISGLPPGAYIVSINSKKIQKSKRLIRF